MTGTGQPPRRVLVADNDPGVTGVLRMFLERAGLSVETAADGVEALERLRAGGIDLLICDLDMPRMSGEEVLAELRRLSPVPPVMVVSGYVDARMEATLGSHPAVREVLRKPFDLAAFSRRAAALAAPVCEPGATAEGGLF